MPLSYRKLRDKPVSKMSRKELRYIIESLLREHDEYGLNLRQH
jgi:hypothetical protein